MDGGSKPTMALASSNFPSPSSSPVEVLAELTPLNIMQGPLSTPSDSLEPRSPEEEEVEEVQRSSTALELIESLVGPLTKLDRLICIEEARAMTEGIESPLLPGLVAAAQSFRAALLPHGVETLNPCKWDRFDRELHAQAALKVRPDAEVASAPPPRPEAELLVVDVHQDGLRHAPSGRVLRKAVVATQRRPRPRRSAVEEADAESALPSASVAARHHQIQPTDTLVGIAVRYGVAPARLLQYNKLPGAHALSMRSSVLIPPPPMRAPDHVDARSRAEDETLDEECSLLARQPCSGSTALLARHHSSGGSGGDGDSGTELAALREWPAWDATIVPNLTAFARWATPSVQRPPRPLESVALSREDLRAA